MDNIIDINILQINNILALSQVGFIKNFRVNISILNLNVHRIASLFISSPIRLFHNFKPSLHHQKSLYIQLS